MGSASAGPFPLDLGDLLYAPNCFEDGRGRHIMLGWLQEHASRQGDFDYSGCLTLPRILTVRGEHRTCACCHAGASCKEA